MIDAWHYKYLHGICTRDIFCLPLSATQPSGLLRHPLQHAQRLPLKATVKQATLQLMLFVEIRPLSKSLGRVRTMSGPGLWQSQPGKLRWTGARRSSESWPQGAVIFFQLG